MTLLLSKIPKFKSLKLNKNGFRYLTTQRTDVGIVGGGACGLAIGCALGTQLLKNPLNVSLPTISIIDRNKLEVEGNLPLTEEGKINYSNRVISLTQKNCEFLKEIGAWNLIDHSRITAFTNMKVTDADNIPSLNFNLDEISAPQMGYIIEISNLQNALLFRLNELKLKLNINLIDKADVLDIKRGEDNWPKLELSEDRSLECRLLIGADGAQSPVRKFGSIESTGWDYDQLGLVATLQTQSLNNHTAYQRFLPTGPIALLPLNQNQHSLVWSTRPHIAPVLKTLSPELFSKLVQAAFTASIPDLEFLIERAMNKDLTLEDLDLSWRPPSPLEYVDEFPKIEHVQDKSRAMFPLKLRHVEKYCDDRLALAGDAAHTVHPLAGQGLNLGLMDAKSLAYTLAHGHNTGQDLGSIHLLKHYSTEQYTRNLVMLGATDKLYRLFSNDINLLSQARSLGIDVFNKIPGLKNFSVRHAMGL